MNKHLHFHNHRHIVKHRFSCLICFDLSINLSTPCKSCISNVLNCSAIWYDPFYNPNKLDESSEDDVESLNVQHIVNIVYFFNVSLLVCSIIFLFERLTIKVKSMKKKKRLKSLLWPWILSLLLVVVIHNNFDVDINEMPLMSFGVSSMFTPLNLGGPHAILGYAYYPKINSLIKCFHRAQTQNPFPPTATFSQIPRETSSYKFQDVVNFKSYAVYYFEQSGQLMLCERLLDGTKTCRVIDTNSARKRSFMIEFVVPKQHVVGYANAYAPNKSDIWVTGGIAFKFGQSNSMCSANSELIRQTYILR